jgi:hypothetical protein
VPASVMGMGWMKKLRSVCCNISGARLTARRSGYLTRERGSMFIWRGPGSYSLLGLSLPSRLARAAYLGRCLAGDNHVQSRPRWFRRSARL